MEETLEETPKFEETLGERLKESQEELSKNKLSK